MDTSAKQKRRPSRQARTGCEMGELLVHNRWIRLIRHFNPFAYSEFVFVRLTGFVKGNFSLRFLMWQAKGGNHKGLPPLEFSPFGKPLSLTPLLRLRWRKSAVLACLPPFRCAGASAVLARNCTRTSTLDRSDVLFFQFIFS